MLQSRGFLLGFMCSWTRQYEVGVNGMWLLPAFPQKHICELRFCAGLQLFW